MITKALGIFIYVQCKILPLTCILFCNSSDKPLINYDCQRNVSYGISPRWGKFKFRPWL